MVVENVIGGLKLRWLLLKTIWHHSEEMHNQVWYIAAFIHNEEMLEGKELHSTEFFLKNDQRKQKKKKKVKNKKE